MEESLRVTKRKCQDRHGDSSWRWAVGTVGATAARAGVGAAIANPDRSPERSKYKVFSPGRIGKMTLKNRLVRSAAYEGGGATTGEVTDDMLRIHRAYAEGR